jgi:group I intron endonuclease
VIIYKITNTKNGLCYVGLSVHDGRTRWRGHLMNSRKAKPQQLIDKAIRKHGAESFRYEVIERIDAAKGVVFLEKREQFWIHRLKTFDRRHGYNLALGTYTNVGHSRTDKYRKAAEERNQVAVLQYDLYGKYLRVFKSVKSAAKSCHTSASNIRRVIRQGRGSAGGFIWKRASSDKRISAKKLAPHKPKTRAKRVVCFSQTGALVKEFSSALEAEQSLGVDHRSISAAINGKVLTAGGYAWSTTPKLSGDRLRRLAKRGSLARKPRGVVAFDAQGVRVGVYRSLSQASIETECQMSLVSSSCLGTKPSVPTNKFGRCRFVYVDQAPAKLLPLDPDKIRSRTKAVAQYTLGGKKLAVHESIKEAAIAAEAHPNSITNAVRDRVKSSAGFQWRFHADGSPSPSSLPALEEKRSVCQYSYHGHLVATYETHEDAAKTTKRALSTIWQAAQGITYSAAGHYWRLFPKNKVPSRIKTPPPRR